MYNLIKVWEILAYSHTQIMMFSIVHVKVQ